MKQVLILIIAALLLFSCQQDELILMVNDGLTQGTTYHIVYESPDSNNYHAAIDSLLIEFDYSLSTYNDSSMITAINLSDTGGLVDQHFQVVYSQALEVYYASKKLFDITVGPLINAYGFGNQKPINIDSAKIDSLLQYVGMHKISLDSNRLTKENKNITIDVNALAQGYSVDLVSEFLTGKGIKNYLVEIGGEVYASGKKGNDNWKVGIDKPVENNLLPGSNLQAIVKLQNLGLATSGNYRKFYEQEGMKIVHTINPVSGYPETHNLLSATILAPECITADAYATACMVMGPEASKNLIDKNPEIDGYLIYSDSTGKYQVYKSEGAYPLIEEVSVD
ncbi:MAG: FAD:protein FMN transferase [Bacteroidetes bacterium]|jgi:thiamine biosynthesis lipoprotein|nr:FAD:protein FMN transferase [Bacteroidota bacterium]